VTVNDPPVDPPGTLTPSQLPPEVVEGKMA
jgi:hypothetical protein